MLLPITLDELVAEAGLLTRVDRKYVIPSAVLDSLVAAVSDCARILQIDGEQRFAYRSVYLDTPDLAAYRWAGTRRRRRFKVRSRSYLDTGSTWLEVKTRGPRGSTVKERTPHPDAARGLSRAGSRFVAERLAAHHVPGVLAEALQPALVTTYDRSTLHLPGRDGRPASRVTLDTGLSWRLPGTRREVDLRDLAIVETKGGALPSPADRALWALGHRPCAMSKYGVGLAALHPELPPLKWHRTLAHHLTAA